MREGLFQNPPARLAWAFAASLAVFLVWRWEPAAWLEHELADRLAQAAARAGVQVSWRALEVRGLRLVVEDARLTRGAAAWRLAHLELAPDWRALAHGRLGVRAWLREGEARAALRLARRDGGVAVTVEQARLPASMLDGPIAARAPVAVAMGGWIEASGQVALDGRGVPLRGELAAHWDAARARAPGFGEVALGAYRLEARADGGGDWRWTLRGGTALAVQASGGVQANSPDPARWPLRGEGRVKAGAGAPPILATMLRPGAKYHIEGRLLQPVLRLQ